MSLGEPRPPAEAELLAVLHQTVALIRLPENDFSWSSWVGAEEAMAEMEQHMIRVRRGDRAGLSELAVLFAPTGPIQEVSLSSGWGREFLLVAEKFDAAWACFNRAFE